MYVCGFVLLRLRPPTSTRTDPRFPYATLFRSPEGPGHSLSAARHGHEDRGYKLETSLRLGVSVAAGGVPSSPSSRSSTARRARRSVEHTSELQSLMRISYAVFCLNKKNNYVPTPANLPGYFALSISNIRA